MAVTVETTYVLQALLGAAVGAFGLAVSGALLMAPGRTPARWALAIGIGLLAGAQFARLRFLDPATFDGLDPANPWMRWQADVETFMRLSWLALFAFVPARVRWRSPRGVLLLVVGALLLAGALAWLFARPLVWDQWPLGRPGSSRFTFFYRVTTQSGLSIGVLALIVAAVHEARARGEGAPTAFLLVAAFPFLFTTIGRDIPLFVRSWLDEGNAFAIVRYLNGTPGDVWQLSLILFVSAIVLAVPVAIWLWRVGGTRLALAIAGAGLAVFLLVQIAPFGWGFWEVNVLLSAILVIVAAQRRGAFGRFVLPASVPLALALLAASCVFLAVNSYTLSFDHEVVLASGIFAGTLLGAIAAVAMLPRGQLHLPWSHAPAAGRELAAYRSALQAEIAAGLSGDALGEKLRPLRGELGLSDRDHAVLEHALRWAAPGANGGAALQKGDVLLGRYRVERLLGEGGAGEVYLAHDARLDRAVALKRLTQDETRDRAALERFQKETRLASALQHPNIVAVHDIEIVGNEAYVVMEHVGGGTLEQALRNGPLDEERVRGLAREVLDALSALHAQGIVHRDVKPSNILLDAHGRAKLSDFSVARVVVSGETVGFTREAGAPVGTPAFMAPEQARGHPATPRSDIYSLGATLYAALTGRAPLALEGLSEFEARIRVASERPALPIRGVSTEVNDALARAMARDPSERFPSAATMRDALA